MIWACLCGLFYIFLISIIVHNHSQERTIVPYMGTIQNNQQKHASTPDTPVPILTVFDLGVGNASVIQLPDHKAILINTGDLVFSTKLLQQLHSLAIDEIDTILLTDTDYRHAGGLGLVLQSYPVAHVLLPKTCPKSITRMLDEQNIDWHSVTSSIQNLQIDALQFDLLANRDVPTRLALRCSFHQSTVWFLDPEFSPQSSGKETIPSAENVCIVDHGFLPDAIINWIKKMQTRYVVLTSIDGLQNAQNTVQDLEVEGIYTFRTDQNGSRTFVLHNNQMSIQSN
jgi:beta-lactamase superfamily II metal-dependent hydrolase